jgi:hypothetical protein
MQSWGVAAHKTNTRSHPYKSVKHTPVRTKPCACLAASSHLRGMDKEGWGLHREYALQKKMNLSKHKAQGSLDLLVHDAWWWWYSHCIYICILCMY